MIVNKIPAEIYEQISKRFAQTKDIEQFCHLLNFCQNHLYSQIIFSFSPIVLKKMVLTDQKKLYKTYYIQKKNGNSRQIDAPIPELKVFLQCVKVVFEAIYKIHHSAHGFVSARSVLTNAKIHINSNYVFNIDLKDFFHSIEIGRILSRFTYPPFNFNKDNGREIIGNYIAWLSCIRTSQKTDNAAFGNEILKQVLPQGSPLSPILTNIICERLDRKLLELAKLYGAKYSRYADDITFSSSTNVFKKEDIFRKSLIEIITAEMFLINDEKVRLQKRGQRQSVTGITVNVTPNLPSRYLKELRMWLYYLENYSISRVVNIFTLHQHKNKNIKPSTSFTSQYLFSYLRGKLNYLGMIRGKENLAYNKLLKRFELICAKNESDNDLSALNETLQKLASLADEIVELKGVKSTTANKENYMLGQMTKRYKSLPALSMSVEKSSLVDENFTYSRFDKYQNIIKLNRTPYNNVDNFLNPMIAVRGAKLRISVYNPEDDGLTWSDIPFIEYDSKGYPINYKDRYGKSSHSFQDFLERHNNPVAGDLLYDDNVPMRADCLALDGKWYRLGLAVPSVNWFGLHNVTKKNSRKVNIDDEHIYLQYIEIQRGFFRAVRKRVINGLTDFEITDRKQEIMKKAVDPSGKSISLPLSITDSNPSTIVIPSGLPRAKLAFRSKIGYKYSEYFYQYEKPSSFVFENSRDIKKFDRTGTAYRVMYTGTEYLEEQKELRKVYKLSKLSSSFNQKLLQALHLNYNIFKELTIVLYVLKQDKKRESTKEPLKASAYQVTKEERRIFLKYKRMCGGSGIEKVQLLVNKLQKMGYSFHIINKDQTKFGFVHTCSGLTRLKKLKPFPISKIDATNFKTMRKIRWGLNVQIIFDNTPYPIIDTTTLDVSDYVSVYSGRTGYRAVIEDAFSSPYLGYSIVDNTHDSVNKPTITIFATAPQIFFSLPKKV